ncbi:hypothetical protein [Microvirga massiliensis]|uniref:hypothetical protein n=1 Tax=Microvirga massiliensis TaxID=1033741 RepID=UPI00062BADDC|nr:hypothetical protein [Microvirga massiliensis]
MPNIDPQERQRLKQQSAQMAITDANYSQYFAAAAGVVALVSPVHAAILGIGAGMMGVCGNYRQTVANDPPRDDFAEVWVSGAVLDEQLLPSEEPARTLVRFAAHHMLVMDALYALLRSLERLDGAVNAQDLDAAAAQADAAGQNANLLANLQDSLISISRDMNEATTQLRANAPGFGQVTLDDVVRHYREAWGDPPANPGASLQEVAAIVSGAAEDLLEPFDPVEAHPILSATEMPPDRDIPIEKDFFEELAENSSTLRSLSTS